MSADALAARLLELLDRDDVDAAIDAGLAGFDPAACASLPADARELPAPAAEPTLTVAEALRTPGVEVVDCDPALGVPANWSLYSFEPAPGYMATFAWHPLP